MDRKTQCLEDIRMRILTLDIAPGSDLDEAALCEQYGISRTPMREVFQRLSGEGYLRSEQNRGTKVASMDLTSLRMFFQTAPMIYASTTKLAAENRRISQIEELKEIQRAHGAATLDGDAGQSSIMNHRFHWKIGEMSQNPYLLPSLNRMLIDHTRMSQTFYRPKSEDDQNRIKTAIEHHEQMIEAIEQQEPNKALELTLEHWNLSRDRLEQFVSPDPLPIDVFAMKDMKHAV
ncbi:GntR family transcriptional regulator [Roseovarius sp. EL26]|uniref:GntR family transcriptional regulator n=1 Tax=Roseovarius sp. EL26 TaxID=2126672 RepID=UPI0020B12038|nr:GntR family transcriptional regulator [Roseovarius sp. EL26]